jgi:hypothetical protein
MTGIAAPEQPRIMVSVIGISPDLVRVFDARRSRADVDMVRVELGDRHIAGDLRMMNLVVERMALALVEIERARNGDSL